MLYRFACCFVLMATAAYAGHVPTVDELLKVKSAGSAEISPDGKWVAYVTSQADFEQDAFVSQIWIAEVATRRNYQVTRGTKSSSNPVWSPDSKWLAFTSNRIGDKEQVFAIQPDGGEAIQLTKSESAIGGFAWAPDMKTIAFIAAEDSAKAKKARKDSLGDFEVVRNDYSYRHIFTLIVADAMKEPQLGKLKTKGKDFSVGTINWSPDGTRIAFSATRNPDLIQGGTGDIYVLTVSDNGVAKIVDTPGPDSNPIWSPDGTTIAFISAMENPKFFHSNPRIAVVSASGGKPRSISDAFDERPILVDWKSDGIYFSGQQRTNSHLFRVDPQSGKVTKLSRPEVFLGGGFSMTQDGSALAFTAPSSTSLTEVYVTGKTDFEPRAMTSMTIQLKDFTLGSREVVTWKSSDGTEIEGILIKPANFDPTKKYPLLCILHGGPTGVDRPTQLDSRYYPADIWVGRGALVLKVNYRGSAGYGEKFRQLNVRNLGVGDAWDVLSGIDALTAKGWVDEKRMGCMGWSQGGYISAFLTTSTTRFAAISVGAGISNWSTYYYNTDITPFTIQYLGADPAVDPQIYLKTSPMTSITKAKTPTLIQHGELDKRVPIANAYELRQGLEDRGVPVEMIVYKGYGHGITKPKSMKAVMEHNLAWFNHYLWADVKPDFVTLGVKAKASGDEVESAVK